MRDFFRLGTHLYALVFLAVIQPILANLAQQPAFLSVRKSEAVDVWSLVLLLSATPFLASILVKAVSRWGLPSKLLRTFLLALPLTALLVQWGRSLPIPGSLIVLLGAGLAVFLAWQYEQAGNFQKGLSFLAVLSVATTFYYLLLSPIARVLSSDLPPGVVHHPQKATTPVVFILLDEFPTSSLMDREGKIDSSLFPNFSRLAQNSTWYRNATTVGDFTTYAVSSILTGNVAPSGVSPDFRNYPRSLFTFLGGTYDIRAQEHNTHLAPPSLTRRTGSSYLERLESLVYDIGVIYGHTVLPRNLSKEYLPSIHGQWMNFGLTSQLYNRDQSFRDYLEGLENKQQTLYYLHSCLPHYPYTYTPEGHAYDNQGEVIAEGIKELSNRQDVWDTKWSAAQAYQRHLLQAVFTDKLLGEAVQRLKETGLWDDCLLIVMADHGAGFRPDKPHRVLDENAGQDTLHIPLFIKKPGQDVGSVDDRPVQSIDVLPTIAEILDEPLPWPTEGRPISEIPSSPTTAERRITGKFTKGTVVVESGVKELLRSTEYKHALFGPGGDGIESLYRAGPYRDIWGRKVEDLPLAEPSRLQVKLSWPELLERVDPESHFQPVRLAGLVNGQPGAIAVAVNGRIRATTLARPYDARNLSFTAMIPTSSLVAGSNKVEIFSVTGPTSAPVLHLIPKAENRTFALESGQLVSSSGQEYRITPGALQGSVDDLELNGVSLVLRGWAAQLRAGKVAEGIVVFAEGDFVLTGPVGWLRIDLEERFGKSLRTAGFTYELPAALVGEVEPEQIRVFAISADGEASELNYGYRIEL